MKEWKVGIVTVSDKGSVGEREDKSGMILQKLIESIHGYMAHYEIIPDEQNIIENTLIKFCDDYQCDLILTTGGTGFADRDVTPEATKAIIEKEVPGIPEKMRATTQIYTKFAVLSRAACGIRGHTLIINFPGSPKGVQECFDSIADILPHALKLLQHNVDHDSV